MNYNLQGFIWGVGGGGGGGWNFPPHGILKLIFDIQ